MHDHLGTSWYVSHLRIYMYVCMYVCMYVAPQHNLITPKVQQQLCTTCTITDNRHYGSPPPRPPPWGSAACSWRCIVCFCLPFIPQGTVCMHVCACAVCPRVQCILASWKVRRLLVTHANPDCWHDEDHNSATAGCGHCVISTRFSNFTWDWLGNVAPQSSNWCSLFNCNDHKSVSKYYFFALLSIFMLATTT